MPLQMVSTFSSCKLSSCKLYSFILQIVTLQTVILKTVPIHLANYHLANCHPVIWFRIDEHETVVWISMFVFLVFSNDPLIP